MNARTLRHNACSIATATLSVLVLSVASTWAVTAPTPDTTFTAGGNNVWTNAANWSNGVPVASPGSPDDALIANGQTAFHNQTTSGEPLFGTLTLGVGSTFQLQAGSNQGIPTGQDVYFSNGSVLQYTAGSSNRDADFFVLDNSTGTWRTATTTFFRGTLNGNGNFVVIMGGNVESRVEASGFTGHLTYQSNSATVRELSNFGQFGGTTSVGSGGATIADKVFLTQAQGNRMNDAATIIMSGAGGANYKWRTPNSETIANLIIESPNQTGQYLITGNGTNSSTVRVTNTATFQGNAGTVGIQSQMNGSFGNPLLARASGVDINANNFLFQGTGNWTINGSKVTTGTAVDPINYAIGSIGVVGGGTVTTHTDVTVNAAFDAPNGFTKAGNGKLTLTYLDPQRVTQSNIIQSFNPKGIVNVNAGILALGGDASLNATSAVNVAAGATLLHNSSTAMTIAPTLNGGTLGGTGLINAALTLNSVGDTLSPGNSPGIMPFAVSQVWNSFAYDWEVNNWQGDLIPGGGVPGTDFDQITIAGSLTLSGTDYLLNVLSLDNLNAPGELINFAETSQSWTILSTTGGITGFDASNWQIDATGFTNDELGSFVLTTGGRNGNDLVLTYRPFSGVTVPEPTTAALGLLGLAGLMMRRRRAA